MDGIYNAIITRLRPSILILNVKTPNILATIWAIII